MKRLLVLILAFLLCTSAIAEGRPGRGGGDMMLLNEGIELMEGADYDAALDKFNAAINAGNIKAARYIGMMYEQGHGVEQDYTTAAEYYAQGVDAGDLTSGYYLGLLYEQGLGVGQDYAKAAELFTSVSGSTNKSATGVVVAGVELAKLYEQGLGVEQDMEKAMELYQEAASYGDETAIEWLAE